MTQASLLSCLCMNSSDVFSHFHSQPYALEFRYPRNGKKVKVFFFFFFEKGKRSR
jgi:hypothetical protein